MAKWAAAAAAAAAAAPVGLTLIGLTGSGASRGLAGVSSGGLNVPSDIHPQSLDRASRRLLSLARKFTFYSVK